MRNILKKYLAVALSAVLLLTTYPFVVASAYEDGDLVEFGSYPQTEVTDSSLLKKLNSQNLSWISYKYYNSNVSGNWMQYSDVMYNGEKYRAVKFTEYREYSSQKQNGYTTNNVYWFKFEPIKWRILDSDAGLVMSEIIIDAQRYSETLYRKTGAEYAYSYFSDSSYRNYANNYANSSIRQWLVNSFYDTAFNTTEKEEIVVSVVDNTAFRWASTDNLFQYEAFDSRNTNDKIFLLSFEEANNSEYGFTKEKYDLNTDTALLGKSTDYAKCQGSYNNQGLEEEYDSWYLRTASYSSEKVCTVTDKGTIEINSDADYLVAFVDGVRPAMYLDFISEDNIEIKTPTKTAINYGETLVLQLEEIEIPEGYAIAWFVEGAGVSTTVSEDGLECRVTSIANGNPTIYAKLVDEEENVVTNADGEEIFDEITLVSKAGFWQKFISFFKNLFGINRVIY